MFLVSTPSDCGRFIIHHLNRFFFCETSVVGRHHVGLLVGHVLVEPLVSIFAYAAALCIMICYEACCSYTADRRRRTCLASWRNGIVTSLDGVNWFHLGLFAPNVVRSQLIESSHGFRQDCFWWYLGGLAPGQHKWACIADVCFPSPSVVPPSIFTHTDQPSTLCEPALSWVRSVSSAKSPLTLLPVS